MTCFSFKRPGSVEITAALTVSIENDMAKVQQALNTYNKSGSIGSIPWIARYWGTEGKYRGLFR